MTAPTPYTPADGHIICLRRDVPKDWQYRYGDDGTIWRSSDGAEVMNPSILVEARPVRQPDPQGAYVAGAGLVTSVGEMRGRTDLDQWEYADTEGYWNTWSSCAEGWWDNVANRDESFPVIVRRVS